MFQQTAIISSLLIITSFKITELMADCPHLCECKWKSGKESVTCLNANLTSVPLQLDAGTQVLDLTMNNLVSVKNDEFSQAGLLNLQKIFLARCKLRNLDKYSFRNLINLVELDLSYNALNAIPSHVFATVPELRELKLSGNPIQRITNEAFVKVPHLVRLELSDCKIGSVELKAFHGLEKSLEWLKLDKNRLNDVEYMALTILHSLHGLDLAGNPWNCSCNLRPLREWMLRNNIPFGIPPVCQYPKRLQGRSWDKLDLDEFACVPEIFAYEAKTHGVEGKNVTMTCRITGVPAPHVRWLLKNKVIANLTGTHYSNGKKLYVVHLKKNASDLTILAADVQDAGVYVCAAENKAGRAEASVTLAVSRRSPDNTLSGRVIIVSVIGGTFLVFVASLIAVCFWIVRKKKNKSRIWGGRRECRNEDNYEKIEMNHKSGNANGRINQSSVSVVESVRKNGEYRVVPGADTDQEGDEEEDVTETSVLRNGVKETKFINPAKVEKKTDCWSIGEQIDGKDLHIPRRNLDTRDDFKSTTTSTSGIYNGNYQLPSTSMSANIATSFHTNFYKKTQPDGSSCNLFSSNYSSDLSSLAENEYEQKYPDLLENSSSPKKINNLKFSKACSEGGSIDDISDIFCTLPRKRALLHNSRYLSTDSQSPLLPESRYASSGGDSSGGSRESCRRLSDSQKYPYVNMKKTRVNPKSGSYLNLTTTSKSGVTNSPIQEMELVNATPLLDVCNLENRVMYKKTEVISPTPSVPSTNANTYDYHAAQLERFLEEYRNLQKQLTKMKETCDNMRQDKGKFLDPLLQNSLPVTPSSSEESNSKTLLKKSPILMPISPNANQSLEDAVRLQDDIARFLITNNAGNNMNNS